MRVIIFSRNFPKTHPRSGEPTNFVKLIKRGTKKHTIRPGSRWKPGDKFSARYWSGLPYRSKQKQFATLEIKKIWPITIVPHHEHGYAIHIGDRYVADWTGTANITIRELAAHDGLTKKDFLDWFGCLKKKIQPFSGQIICWNDKKINY